MAHITLALKDETGSFSWVELDPKFCSHLFKLAFSLLGKLITPEAQRMYKKAIFVYILEILNQEREDLFLTPNHSHKKTAHTKWEKLSPAKTAPPTNVEDHQHKEDIGAQTGQQVEIPTLNENTWTNPHTASLPPAEPAIITESTDDTPTDPLEKEVEEFLKTWTKTNYGETTICNGTMIGPYCGRPATHLKINRMFPEWSYTRCEEHSTQSCEPIPSRLLTGN